MATKIVTKNSSTAGSAPSASDLVQGELAVNVVDKRLYTEDNAGNIVELGTNPLGEITANGGIALGDNDKATFGASDDLQIYHDGSNSLIKDTGSGGLSISGSVVNMLNTGSNEFMFQATEDGAIQLFHNGAEKLATTATGIDVTGTATVDSLVSSGNVGIGTDLSYKLGIKGLVSFEATNSTNRWLVYTHTDNTLRLNYNGAGNDEVVVDSSGNIQQATSVNSDLSHSISNANTGTASQASLYITNSSADADGFFAGVNGSSATTASGFVQDGAYLGSGTGASGGLSIMTRANADMRFYTNGHTNERMRIDTSGRLSLNTSGSIAALDGVFGMQIGNSSAVSAGLALETSNRGYLMYIDSSSLVFWDSSDNSERMRIDSSGNLLVGKIVNDNSTVGGSIRAGESTFTALNSRALTVGRSTNSGELIQFRLGTGTVGSIGIDASGNLQTLSATGNYRFGDSNTSRWSVDSVRLYPMLDNTYDIGLASLRAKDIYATNGTIQTSDAREKTAVRELTDAEMRVAKKLSKNIGFFQWLSAVEEKGEDARSHCGQTVQGVIAEFEAEGLDAFDYAMVCYNEWEAEFTEHPAIEAVEAVEAVEGVEAVEAVEAVDAVLNEDGEIVSEAIEAVEAVEGVDAVEAVEAVEAVDAWTEQTQEQGDRFSLRADQLNHFMIRGLSQNQSELEARLIALEE